MYASEIHVHEIQFALSVSIYAKLVEFAQRNRNRNRKRLSTWILLNYATCLSFGWPHTHCCFAFSNWLHIFFFFIFTSTKSGENIDSSPVRLAPAAIPFPLPPWDRFAYWIWWWNNWNSTRNKSQMNSTNVKTKCKENAWRIGKKTKRSEEEELVFGSFVSFLH